MINYVVFAELFASLAVDLLNCSMNAVRTKNIVAPLVFMSEGIFDKIKVWLSKQCALIFYDYDFNNFDLPRLFW